MKKTGLIVRIFFGWIYNLLLLFFFILILPKIIYERIRFGKYSGLFAKKLGTDFKNIKKSKSPLVWCHAVSMGETKAVWKFIELLQHQYPNVELLITSTTETGHAEAKHSFPFAKHHLYLPFDFSWIIAPIVRRLKPALVILSEGDYWYHFLKAAKTEGAYVAVVNGKLSSTSCRRYQWFGSFLNTYFSPVDIFCVQNKIYEERFKKLNIPSSRLAITGNLKFDAAPERLSHEEALDLRKKLKVSFDDWVIVAGSTHSSEELLILESYKQLALVFKNLKIIFVPRHPERFKEVEGLLSTSAIPFSAYSKLQESTGENKIILIDSMGLLKKCYQLADVAIVGGSFVSHVGGHNILEPLFYGVPVVFGPFMHTQTELMNLILDAHAGIQTDSSHLLSDLQALLESQEKKSAISKSGKDLTDTLQGTSLLTLETLEKKFELSKHFSLPINSEVY